MGFSLNCKLDGMEYRGVRAGTSKSTGRPWMTLILEDTDAQQVEVSVPGDFQSDVYSLGLRKGDFIDVDVRAVAYDGSADRPGNSYIQLTDVPVLVADADGVVE